MNRILFRRHFTIDQLGTVLTVFGGIVALIMFLGFVLVGAVLMALAGLLVLVFTLHFAEGVGDTEADDATGSANPG